MKSRSLLSLLLLLLIAAALPSCKSPTAPAPTGPTLTLILPDSAHVFDTVTFRSHYPDYLKITWYYAWQFGDSGKASTTDTGVTHVYDSAGTYTVQVSLKDTDGTIIAKQSAAVQIMPLNVPTLTLTVPDTTYWGDSCVMSVSSSQPLKAGWKFSWSLGDSTAVTGTDSVLHYYLTPGNYKVTVSLNDTVHHILLASKSAIIPVVARHFNLALLQSMKYVSVTWSTFLKSDTVAPIGFGNSCDVMPYRSDITKPLLWSGAGFVMHANSSWNDSSIFPHELYPPQGSESILDSGTLDPGLTQLTSFSQDSNVWFYSGSTGTFYCNATYNASLSINSIPFASESDSDVVFAALGTISKNGNYSSSTQTSANGGSWSIKSQGSLSRPNSYIILRFHK
jgi:PKD repeat protein